MPLPKDLHLLEKQYETHTAAELAKMYNTTWGCMRWVLSANGIKDPKKKLRKCDLLRLWLRGTVEEIAEYLGCAASTVFNYCRRLGLIENDGQLSFWPREERRRKPEPTRLRAVGRNSVSSRQTELDLVWEPQMMAA